MLTAKLREREYIFMTLHDAVKERFGHVKKLRELLTFNKLFFNSSGCEFEF